MSPSHPHTVGAAVNTLPLDDDEDNDICPVCDGECTCNHLPMASSSDLGIAPAPPAFISPPPKLPVLKIKLTVPQGMLGNRKQAHPSGKSTSAEETMSAVGNDDDYSYTYTVPNTLTPTPSNFLPAPKRRGRPPKLNKSRPGPSSHPKPKSSLPKPRAPRKPVKPKRKPNDNGSYASSSRLPPKKASSSSTTLASHKRKLVLSGESSSELSSIDEDDDDQSVKFPTFVSASAISSTSTSSESDSDSLAGFDTDSSDIEAEEENFILTEERARVKRELLLSDNEGGGEKRKRDNWIIKPRKMSVGAGSDVDMDVDSDATEDEDEDEEEEEDEEDADADEELLVGEEEEDEEEEERDRRRYKGVATGWSDADDDDGEESSFDADLFFANLSDSHDSDGSSTSNDEGGEDGDQSDLESSAMDLDIDEAAMSLIPHIRNLRRDLENMPFEVTEGWDGQIVFTNGLTEGQGFLDADFEANAAAHYIVETSASPSQEESEDMDIMSDVDENGYEQDGNADGGEGDTTDEELVGEDDLPNERAMKLFNLPFSVSSINPMSTLSPSASPAPNNRRPMPASLSAGLDSPKPADILAGKVSFWGGDDSDEHDNDGLASLLKRRGSELKGEGGPRTGTFEPPESGKRQAVIDDKHLEAPSPHPRFTGRRNGRSRLSASHTISASHDGIQHLFPRHIQLPRPSSLPPSTRLLSLSLLSPSSGIATSPDLAPTEPIDLDDVLDSSFLDSDDHHFGHGGNESSSSTNTATRAHTEQEVEHDTAASKKHMKNLSRWDLISVGAFRKTREGGSGVLSDSAAGWGSDAAPGNARADYGTVMKGSPLSLMLWHNKNGGGTKPSPQRDGNRTPTNAPMNIQKAPVHDKSNKSRKELRRERKLKRKGFGAVHHQHQHHSHPQHHAIHHQHHYQHQHHPNSKSRSASSSHRTNFFNTAVPPLSI